MERTHFWHGLGAPKLVSLLHRFLLGLGRFMLNIKDLHSHFNILYRYIYRRRQIAIFGCPRAGDSGATSANAATAMGHEFRVIFGRGGRRVRWWRLAFLLAIAFFRAS